MLRFFRSILGITTVVMTLSTLFLGGGIFYGAALYRNTNIEQQQLSEWFANKLAITHSLSTKFLEHSQEWKSILLRGQDSNQYHAHLSHFFDLEREIRNIVNELKIDIARGNDSLQLLTQFDMEFRQLGKDYRGAIRAYNDAADNPHLIADKLTQHAKIPETIIAEFVIAMNAWRNTEITEIAEKTISAERNILIILSAILLLSLAIVIFILRYWVIIPIGQATNHAHRIAVGRLDNNIITEHTSNEASSLMSALNIMQSNIKKSQESLVDERKKADKANQAKSQFLSSMSHELRTPMNAILGFGQLLELNAEGFNEIQKDNVREILDAGYHLLHLINEVLDLAKIESGKLEVHMEAIPVDDVLKQCVTLISSQAEARQLELIDHVCNKGHIVHADSTRLKQVLLNLLSNAVKYNCEHGRITLNSEIVDKSRLRISVDDTGEGLTEDEIAQIFIPFDRLNAKSNVEGTGIGLAITKHLIELMGGTIGVKGVPGKGSSFWIELELSREA